MDLSGGQSTTNPTRFNVADLHGPLDRSR